MNKSAKQILEDHCGHLEAYNMMADWEIEHFVDAVKEASKAVEPKRNCILVKGSLSIHKGAFEGIHRNELKLCTPAGDFILTAGSIEHCSDILQEIQA